MPPLPLIGNQDKIQKARQVFRAINHPLRKKMLQLLEEKQQASVTEIYAHLRLEQSVVSQHLKILREANIVETQRKGKTIYYRPNYERLLKLEEIVSEIIPN